jgi:RNA polymerase sigma-70 factor (ECF subfamily)
VAANHLRRRRRKQPPHEPLSESIPGNLPTPETQAQAAQAVARVQAFCDRLDDGRRVVFVLALVEAVPASEIAPLLGIPLFTVYSRMRTLRAQLQLFLEENEVEK